MTDHDAWMTAADGLVGLYHEVADKAVTMNRLQITVGEDAALSIEATEDGELEVTTV